MQWNTHFDWAANDFHFIEVFAGVGNTSRAWLGSPVLCIACMHASILKIAWWFPKEETRVQCCCLWHCLWWKFWKGIISRLPSICGIFALSSYVIHACIPAHMHMHEYGSMAKSGLLWCAEACCWWNGLDGPRLPLLGQPSQGVKLANWNQPLWHWAWICSEGKLHGFKDPCMHACIFPTGTHI